MLCAGLAGCYEIHSWEPVAVLRCTWACPRTYSSMSLLFCLFLVHFGDLSAAYLDGAPFQPVFVSYIFRKIHVGEVVGTMSSTTVGQGSEGKVCPVWKHSCVLQYGGGPANALWNVWGHQTLSSKQRHSPRARQLHFRVTICFLVFYSNIICSQRSINHSFMVILGICLTSTPLTSSFFLSFLHSTKHYLHLRLPFHILMNI